MVFLPWRERVTRHPLRTRELAEIAESRSLAFDGAISPLEFASSRSGDVPMQTFRTLRPCCSLALSCRRANGRADAQAMERQRGQGRRLSAQDAEQGRQLGQSEQEKVGTTGLVLTGLLKSGKVGADDPMVESGLKYIESLINPKAGHIAGQDPRVQLQELRHLHQRLGPGQRQARQLQGRHRRRRQVPAQLQWDEGEGKNTGDDFYGGAGYDSKSRPDLSNTQFFLDALAAAGIPKDDPAFKKAAVFVSRCQNLKGEHNDQKWAGKINDGSFIYSAAAGGQTKTQDKPNDDGGLPGYGSMTYAGIKSLIYCGVSKDDPRIKKALEWIRKNYTRGR